MRTRFSNVKSCSTIADWLKIITQSTNHGSDPWLVGSTPRSPGYNNASRRKVAPGLRNILSDSRWDSLQILTIWRRFHADLAGLCRYDGDSQNHFYIISAHINWRHTIFSIPIYFLMADLFLFLSFFAQTLVTGSLQLPTNFGLKFFEKKSKIIF